VRASAKKHKQKKHKQKKHKQKKHKQKNIRKEHNWIKVPAKKPALCKHKASGESGVGRDFKGREGPLATRLPLSKKIRKI